MTTQMDRFVHDRMPAVADLPQMLYELPELQFPGKLNAVVELLDRHVADGDGERVLLRDARGVLADFQLTQARLAQMATTIDSAALLTYRAAWQRDRGENVTREAAMAKMVATEGAQQVIDGAVQLFGGLGVVSEVPVERLYREIRALRIYEGATEVQQLIIARELLKNVASNA